MDSTISVSVHPKAGDGIELRGFESDQGVSGFVAVQVPPVSRCGSTHWPTSTR